MFLAASLDEFRTLFANKLIEMLSPYELGAYILVLANSIQDDAIRLMLAHELSDNEKYLIKAIEDDGFKCTQDDADVFEKLRKISTEHLSSWTHHKVGVWDVVSNPFRSLRPTRASNEKVTSIAEDFSEHTFDFNKEFLAPEVLWEGEWKSTHQDVYNFRVLYNKFPFIPYHTLIVPDPDSQRPQYLSHRYHNLIWDLVENNQQQLPGFGAGYNSLGACASVNHLHFHGFILESELPVELKRWTHNGGGTDYPMSCVCMNNMQEAWDFIQGMHAKNRPYNILYRSDGCYILPRKIQGSSGVSDAVSGAGWAEECGLFVAADESEIDLLTENILTENLESLSVPLSVSNDSGH